MRRFISRERRHGKAYHDLDAKELAAQLEKGDRRAVAKAITLAENDGAGAAGLLRAIGPKLGHAFVIGVTGPPGTGKSSLVDRFIEIYRKKGLKVGVVAIDPSSPLTGGALLGDRIRMVDHTMDQGVFIRSMASRGWAGGLSGAVADVIQVLDAAGMDVVMVETVGIGQSDTDVVRVAHAVVVVLMPGIGDDVQASKAGLMEIGDIYVVNKADLAGADDMVVDLLAMARDAKGRNPSVLKVSAAKREGIENVVERLERIRTTFLSSPSKEGDAIRLRSIRGMITELARKKCPDGPRGKGGLEGRRACRRCGEPQAERERCRPGTARRRQETRSLAQGSRGKEGKAVNLAERLADYVATTRYEEPERERDYRGEEEDPGLAGMRGRRFRRKACEGGQAVRGERVSRQSGYHPRDQEEDGARCRLLRQRGDGEVF